MTSVGISSWMLVMLVAGGGSNELLSLVPTDAYWQARNVTVSADEMNRRLAAPKQAAATGPAMDVPEGIDRLMAIRTLGELKNKESLATIEKLLNSKDPFVADYARAAVAQISGKSVEPRKLDPKLLKSDLYLLPKNCALVGQISLGGLTKPQTIAQALKDLDLPGMDKEQAVTRANQAILDIVSRIGNVRVDAVTVGVAEDVGNNTGFVVAVARGLFDPKSVKAALTTMKVEIQTQDGLDVISGPGRGGATGIIASNELVILMVGPSKDTLPINDMIAAVKAGKGSLANNADMAKLINTVDADAAIWAVARPKAFANLDAEFKPFDTATLIVKRKAADVLSVALTATAADSDAEQVAQVVSMVQAKHAQAKNAIEQAAAAMPAVKPLVDLINSVQINAQGGKATITAEIKGLTTLQNLIPMMYGARSSRVTVENGPVTPEGQFQN